MKKTFIFRFTLIALIISLSFTNIYADDKLPDDEYEVDLAFETVNVNDGNIILNAQSAITIEVETGRVLFEKNAYTKKAMASTTKIMTAIVAIEHGKFDEVVTISKNAAYTSGSTVKLKVGEEIKFLDLIYGLMLVSGNDAAVAIAEHVAGSEEEYIKLMNKKAVEMGAVNTNFVTVHGLDDDNHYTTAYDLAIITAECMKNETFRLVVSTAETYISNRSLRNTNDLLFTYEGATGVKTGFTGNAGRCLVASAKRDGMEIITVALGCADKKSRFTDSRKMLNYSFDNFAMTTLVDEGQVLTTIKVIKGKKQEVKLVSTDSVILPMTEAEKKDYEINISAESELQAPCYKDDIFGKIYVTYKGENIAVCDIRIAETIENKTFRNFLMELFRAWKDIA